MKSKSVGDLVHLPVRKAVARYFDAANYRVLRRLLVVLTPIATGATVVPIVNGHIVTGLVWSPVVVVAVWIFFTRAAPFFERYGRQMTMLFLGLVAMATALSLPEAEAAYAFCGFVIPIFLLVFRLRRMEYLALAGVNAGAMAWSLFRPGMPEALSAKAAMGGGSLVVMGLFLMITMAVTRKAKGEFLEVWHHEAARERDRSRMRSELEDAREIQLSMLPVDSPALDWADFASISLPASEVGGDYFDFFELPGSRLAIVIGDVAGHGVASGLVLSGVRSSLHLLKGELDKPVEVLERLDEMLRETVGGRNFVTFQIAVLDPTRERVTVANAGHPPLLLATADGRISQLGTSSLPLGTRLAESEYSEQTETLAEGDTLVMFSDGALEARNLKGEDFGEQRLLDELAKQHPTATASRIRDSLLNALSRFKSDVEQEDDLTLVVLKMGPLSGQGH